MRPIREKAVVPRLSLSTLLILCTLRPVVSSPEIAKSLELNVNGQAKVGDWSQMKMQDILEDGKGIDLKSISKISPDVEPSLRMKKTDKLPLGMSVTAPSPRSRPPQQRYRRLQILKASSKNTYLDALEHSHTIKDARDHQASSTKIARREYTQGPVYRPEDSTATGSNNIETDAKVSRISYNGNAGVPSPVYTPLSDKSYSQPQVFFGANDYSNSYESYGPPPQTSYGPPQHSYGPPQPSYGSPTYPSAGHYYGPSQQGLGSIQATYSTSHPLPDIFPLLFPPLDFSWPVSLKLNAYTLVKIILKLMVFKMIVKFIATICLLLFIPKIIQQKPEQSDDDDEARQFGDKLNFSSERLRPLTSIVTRSIEQYENMKKKNGTASQSCTGLGCQLSRSWFAPTDTWYDYVRLFKSYVAEEQAAQQLTAKKQNSRRRR
ncbi:uncharacterized protein LOC131667965 [Phymastichus coffea]|uniref:uncharacterized protein LOC131667965 n=1 Tax=Phymastichus coffea TaxID=108790 RepID=UPI00273BF04A|nr:uncharacterized protein LOC131667965 [Phymastichus coffea]